MLVIAFERMLTVPKNRPIGKSNAKGTVYAQAPLTKQ